VNGASVDVRRAVRGERPGLQTSLRAVATRWTDGLPGHSWRKAHEAGLVILTLALSAQQVLCAAPLLVAMSAVVRRLSGTDMGVMLTRLLGLTGDPAADVSALFVNSASVPTRSLVFGLVLTAVFSTGIAATIQRGYEAIWEQPRAGLGATGRQLIWVVALLAYISAVLFAGRVGHELGHGFHASMLIRIVAQSIVSLAFFLAGQSFLLAGRVGLRRLLPGSVLTAAGTVILLNVSQLVLPGQITEQVDEYGLIGATFVLSIWLVVWSSIVFGAALAGAVLVERRDERTLASQLTDEPGD
jgi:membrane protein